MPAAHYHRGIDRYILPAAWPCAIAPLARPGHIIAMHLAQLFDRLQAFIQLALTDDPVTAVGQTREFCIGGARE